MSRFGSLLLDFGVLSSLNIFNELSIVLDSFLIVLIDHNLLIHQDPISLLLHQLSFVILLIQLLRRVLEQRLLLLGRPLQDLLYVLVVEPIVGFFIVPDLVEQAVLGPVAADLPALRLVASGIELELSAQDVGLWHGHSHSLKMERLREMACFQSSLDIGNLLEFALLVRGENRLGLTQPFFSVFDHGRVLEHVSVCPDELSECSEILSSSVLVMVVSHLDNIVSDLFPLCMVLELFDRFLNKITRVDAHAINGSFRLEAQFICRWVDKNLFREPISLLCRNLKSLVSRSRTC